MTFILQNSFDIIAFSVFKLHMQVMAWNTIILCYTQQIYHKIIFYNNYWKVTGSDSRFFFKKSQKFLEGKFLTLEHLSVNENYVMKMKT